MRAQQHSHSKKFHPAKPLDFALDARRELQSPIVSQPCRQWLVNCMSQPRKPLRGQMNPWFLVPFPLYRGPKKNLRTHLHSMGKRVALYTVIHSIGIVDSVNMISGLMFVNIQRRGVNAMSFGDKVWGFSQPLWSNWSSHPTPKKRHARKSATPRCITLCMHVLYAHFPRTCAGLSIASSHDGIGSDQARLKGDHSQLKRQLSSPLPAAWNHAARNGWGPSIDIGFINQRHAPRPAERPRWCCPDGRVGGDHTTLVRVRFNAVLDSTVSGQALSLATTFKLLKLLRNCHLKFRLPAGKSFLTRSRQAQEGLAPALGCQFLTIASASLQAYNHVTPCLIPCTRSQCTNSSIKRGAKELEVIATYLRDSESDDTKPPKCQSSTTQKRYQKIIEKPSFQLPFGTFCIGGFRAPPLWRQQHAAITSCVGSTKSQHCKWSPEQWSRWSSEVWCTAGISWHCSPRIPRPIRRATLARRPHCEMMPNTPSTFRQAKPFPQRHRLNLVAGLTRLHFASLNLQDFWSFSKQIWSTQTPHHPHWWRLRFTEFGPATAPHRPPFLDTVSWASTSIQCSTAQHHIKGTGAPGPRGMQHFQRLDLRVPFLGMLLVLLTHLPSSIIHQPSSIHMVKWSSTSSASSLGAPAQWRPRVHDFTTRLPARKSSCRPWWDKVVVSSSKGLCQRPTLTSLEASWLQPITVSWPTMR